MPSQEWFDASPYPATHAADKSEARSFTTVRRIMDKPSDIIIMRGSTPLTSQTVRIEGRSSTRVLGTLQNSNQSTFLREITVFGIRDHPTLPDLNVKVNDRFGYAGDSYMVIGVTLHAGEIQAAAERLQM